MCVFYIRVCVYVCVYVCVWRGGYVCLLLLGSLWPSLCSVAPLLCVLSPMEQSVLSRPCSVLLGRLRALAPQKYDRVSQLETRLPVGNRLLATLPGFRFRPQSEPMCG